MLLCLCYYACAVVLVLLLCFDSARAVVLVLLLCFDSARAVVLVLLLCFDSACAVVLVLLCSCTYSARGGNAWLVIFGFLNNESICFGGSLCGHFFCVHAGYGGPHFEKMGWYVFILRMSNFR